MKKRIINLIILLSGTLFILCIIYIILLIKDVIIGSDKGNKLVQ